MKKQGTIMVALVLIMMALSSNLAEAQLGPGDCYDGCSTACVQRDSRKTSRCDRKCSIRCGPDAKKARETVRKTTRCFGKCSIWCGPDAKKARETGA